MTMGAATAPVVLVGTKGHDIPYAIPPLSSNRLGTV